RKQALLWRFAIFYRPLPLSTQAVHKAGGLRRTAFCSIAGSVISAASSLISPLAVCDCFIYCRWRSQIFSGWFRSKAASAHYGENLPFDKWRLRILDKISTVMKNNALGSTNVPRSFFWKFVVLYDYPSRVTRATNSWL